MKNSAHSAKAFDGLPKPGKAYEEVDMVQRSDGELLGVGGMILPGPHRNSLQID